MPPVRTQIGISASRIRLLCSSREQNKDQYLEEKQSATQCKDNAFLIVNRAVKVQSSLP